ncbi:MAG: alpha-mannosidase [Clostridia bacterium]|nr:alpha-mannosidase [Clostridia bacterium]
MQTPKRQVLAHMMKQIPQYVVAESVEIRDWYAIAGRHMVDGKFITYSKQPNPVSLGDRWESTYDETVWFSAELEIPERFIGRRMYLELDFGGEAIVRINGKIVGGVSNDKEWVYRDKIFLPDPLPEDRILKIELESTINSGAYYDAAVAVGSESITYTMSKASLICVDVPTMDYYTDVQVVWDALEYITDPAISSRVYAAIDDSLHCLDFDFDRATFYASVPEATRVLWEKIEKIKYTPQGEVIMTGHSHIDVAWLWTVRETTRKCARTFSNTVALMEHYPDFTFAQSQAYLYAKTKEVYPELYEQIKEYIAKGQWDVLGNAWVEADTNVAGGEALVRQLLYGREFFLKEFGISSDIYWLPDCFGFSYALPQIIRRSGMKYFVTAKLNNQDTNRFPHTIFRWKGIDGSEILAYLQRTSYNGEYEGYKLTTTWDENDQKNVTDTALGMFGYGDGGGGATYDMVERSRRTKKIPGLPANRIGHASEFFEKSAEHWNELPVWDDEMYYENHRGTYTSQGFVKKNNRRGEFLLTRAEMAATIAGLPADDLLNGPLATAWKFLLINQFHDILPGTSISQVYDNTQREYAEMHHLGGMVLSNALASIVSRIALDEDALVCFNFLGHPVKGAVTVNLEKGFVAKLDGTPLVATESTDAPLRSVTFLTDEEIPPMGYRVFRIVDAPAKAETKVCAEIGRLENEVLRVIFDENGEIISIYDKEAKRETLDGIGNRLTVYQDKPVHESAWNIEANYVKKSWPLIKADSIEVVEANDVRGTIRITRSFSRSVVTQDITLTSGSKQLDFHTYADWHDVEKTLRTAFEVAVKAPYATYDIAHGAITRPTHNNTCYDQAKFEVSAHRWIDLSEGGYGVSLLNDCKYGHDIHGSTMSTTLLRSPNCPDKHSDQGEHEFTYSYYPHIGVWQDGGTVQAALTLNQPVIGRVACAHSGTFPTENSFLSTNLDSMIIDAFKPAQDGDGWILRMYEAESRRGDVTVTVNLPFARVTECNLMEVDETELAVDGNTFTFAVKPFEVRTFRIR